MKIKIIKIIIVIGVIIGWLGAAAGAEAVIKRAGDIEVITDEPMFAETTVWYPGLRVEKSFQVKNRGGGAKTVQIEAENESETLLLPGVLTIQIKEGARGIFGISDSKTLRNFFESAAISLGEVFPDDGGKTFSLSVEMTAGAGNEYQGGRAKFDLRIGFVGDSSSAVTVSGGGTTTAGIEGKEGSEGLEGGRQNLGESGILGELGEGEGTEGLEGGRQNPEGGRQSPGESGGIEEGDKPGKVAGAETEGINWGFWAMIGGILISGGLVWWVWLKRSR